MIRKLITAILLLLSLNGLSQDLGQLNPFQEYEKERVLQRIPEPVKVITICLGSIITDAIGDAWIAEGKNVVWAHTFQATSTGILLMSPFILDLEKRQWFAYGASYVFFRVAVFDYVYNATRGLPLEYRSEVSLWDKALTAVNPPPGIMMFNRGISFSLGLGVTINEIR